MQRYGHIVIRFYLSVVWKNTFFFFWNIAIKMLCLVIRIATPLLRITFFLLMTKNKHIQIVLWIIFFFFLSFHFSLYNIDTFSNKRAENKMTDSKYFTTTKKGEIFELKSELNNDKKEKKKEAVKKVTIRTFRIVVVVIIISELNWDTNIARVLFISWMHFNNEVNIVFNDVYEMLFQHNKKQIIRSTIFR